MRLNGIIQFSPNDLNLIAEALHYIEKQYPVYISAEKLSEEVNIEIRKLQAGFKKKVKYTVHQYQISLRVHRSKADLADYNLSLKEISFKNGFKNANQFRKLFKKHTCQTPLAYRIQLTNIGNHLASPS